MIKKLATLALIGVLAVPTVTLADSLEDRVSALEDSAESWDLSSRISWSGDIRTRADYHKADTAQYYKATEVAMGVMTYVNAQPALAAIAGGFPDIGTMVGPTGLQPIMTDLATWRAAINTYGITDQAQQDALYYMFTNSEVQQLLGNMAAYPTSALTDQMATPEALAGFMRNNLSASARKAIFDQMYPATTSAKYENDTLYTTRFRLNMRAKATENVEVKARLVGYKTWGMQDSSMPETNENGIHDTNSPYFLNSRSFDGTSGRQPVDNKLLVDRAFMNWNNIGGMPVWFSIGRRPVTDGPPAHIRMGTGKKMATPINYMDYPFDGLSLGYAYSNLFGIEDLPGRVRLCYGRGFEAGPAPKDTGVNDVDFAGISWDVFKKGNSFFGFQSFGAFNIFNVPGDTYFPNPIELAAVNQGLAAGTMYQNVETGYYMNNNGTATIADDTVAFKNTYLDRTNLGDIYHTSAIYMDKVQDLNYFLTLGWSHTRAKGTDELGISLMNDFWQDPEDRDGYGVYFGARYDLDDIGLKLGAEYNYGSKYWLAFTPGHDDMYSSKLQTRGSVYELYTVYDLPSGEAVSKFGHSFMRLGYQHYDYEYTYSGMWLGSPNKVDDIQSDPLMAQFYAPVKKMDNVYLTFEAWF